MPTHIFAIHPDGSIEFTRNEALDTMFDGKGEMQRVTEICKLPDQALYYVQWKLGPFKHRPLGYHQFGEYPGVEDFFCTIEDDEFGTLYFASYAIAVKQEVAMLDAMRKAGVSFHEENA
jgi:hypothetical protein